VAEEAEAGASVHLPLEHFRLRVDAFRPPVVVREGERGRGCLDVEVETLGERVEIRQVSGTRAGDSLPQPVRRVRRAAWRNGPVATLEPRSRLTQRDRGPARRPRPETGEGFRDATPSVLCLTSRHNARR